ncbi:MAG: dockerin type I repeat-containing protein [Methanosarcinales archaeon]|jgi:hypothetical protein|nr:dockerin type I repeat-containing protein [Methanosarcinales archaeon]
MNTKEMAASIIAIMMFAAIFVTTAAAFTAPNANDDRVEFEYSEGNCDGLYVNMRNCTYPDDPDVIMDTPTLRIYGEDSYDAAFPYTDPEGPFDPTNSEASGKDFVVFNPAYMPGNFLGETITIHTEDSGVIDGREKVFARQWYVPKYPEPRGKVWATQPTRYSADIVTEYTYMLLDSSNMPVAGIVGDQHATNFWLPIGATPHQIGLNSFIVDPDGRAGTGSEHEMVELIDVGDFDGDGMKDINIATRDIITIDPGRPMPYWIRFMDHAIQVKGIAGTSPSNIYAVVDIYYIGNSVLPGDQIGAENMHLAVGGQQVIAGRHGYSQTLDPRFDMPWYLEVESVGWVNDQPSVSVKVGRLLHMGETFFVDGAEYDIAMIYGPEPDEQTFETFKYITLRNPIPKLIDVTLPVLSITKQHVPKCEVMPLLPPFNDYIPPMTDGAATHIMVDDINLHDCYTGCDDLVCDNILDDSTSVLDRLLTVGPLEIRWAKEEIEPRFDTNLLEILKEPEEIWQWICINIMPNQYTEMAYPPLPDASVCRSNPTDPDTGKVQLGDFLLVSSWEAPNSCNDRMKFAYDAEDPTDIYVNEHEQDDCGVNSVRIYGEGSIDAAFPYTDPEGPFNKLSVDAPRKDFVTFNPAFMPKDYLGESITVDIGPETRDACEKVFVRQWYVPEYPEPRGKVWATQPAKPSKDIVTEYTYMLLDHATKLPIAGVPGDSHSTNFWLPIGPGLGGSGQQIGLDSFVVDPDTMHSGYLEHEMVELIDVGDFDGDGMKDINIATRDIIRIDAAGDRRFPYWIQFMDHAIEVVGIAGSSTNDIYAVVNIYYFGNDDPQQIGAQNMHLDVGGQMVIAGRHGYSQTLDPRFDMPWYLEVESIGMVEGWATVSIKVGRLLHMGETFFADGAEYDIAMIYGPDESGEFTTFKYITFRNPVPKFNPVDLDVLSIRKTPVEPCEKLPMLPPFNKWHDIVDDIGIPTCGCAPGDTIRDENDGCIDACADSVNERIVDDQPPFKSYFVEETVEERFRTNLLEILDEDTPESWDMLCMWTLPWAYTAMVYPDVDDCDCCGDDADFLVTTSGPKTPVQQLLCGDVDGSGSVNTLDVTKLFDFVTYGSPSIDELAADVDNSGSINTLDVTKLFDFVTHGSPPLNCA